MASVADQFTDEQIDEIKEAFNLFDRNNDGNVLIAQLGTLFKMLGVHTTEAEIKVMDRTSTYLHHVPRSLILGTY